MNVLSHSALTVKRSSYVLGCHDTIRDQKKAGWVGIARDDVMIDRCIAMKGVNGLIGWGFTSVVYVINLKNRDFLNRHE